MNDKELVEKASKRDLSEIGNMELYLSAAMLIEDDIEYMKPHFERIYELSSEYKLNAAKNDDTDCAIRFYEIAKKAALALAPHFFHYYLLYVEWDREPSRKFYVPRMKILRVVVEDLQDLADGKLDLLTVSLPPRVGKSTLGIFFMSWIMGRKPGLANVMSGHSDILTSGFYSEVLDIITSEEYLWADVFPTRKIARTSAKNESIDLDRKRRFPTLTCRAVNGTLTGAVEVGNILYVDDIIEDIEEALNPHRLDKKYDTYLNQLKDRKKDGAKELHIGTRWAVNDVIGRLQERYGEDNPRVRYRVIPAIDENGHSNFNYPYNLGFSDEYYADMKASLDPCTWSCKYMGDPYVREGLLFERDTLSYYNGTLPDGDYVVRTAVDVAWGGGDFVSAPIIYWYGDTGYVHDWVYSSKDKTITQPLVATALKRNNVAKAVFEADAGGTSYADDVDKMLIQIGFRTNVQTRKANNRRSKMDKIIQKSTDIKLHLVFRSDKNRGAMYDEALQELFRFVLDGKNKHDDAADSLAMAIEEHFDGAAEIKIVNRFW